MGTKTNKKKSVEVSVSSADSGPDLERHLGKTLLADCNQSPKITSELLKDKKLVGLYFTASWNSMGQDFTPKLAEFYEKCLSNDDMEIVFVCTDDDRQKFLDTYSNMPWLAIDGDKDGTKVKHNLATHLKVFRLPSLVILNVKTGNFVTDTARQQVQALFEKKENGAVLNVQAGKEVIQKWKTQEPEELGHSDTFFNTIYLTAMHFKKQPLWIVGLILFLTFTSTIRRIQNNPLLGMAMIYLLLRIGKEPLDKNLPYVEQKSNNESVKCRNSKKIS